MVGSASRMPLTQRERQRTAHCTRVLCAYGLRIGEVLTGNDVSIACTVCGGRSLNFGIDQAVLKSMPSVVAVVGAVREPLRSRCIFDRTAALRGLPCKNDAVAGCIERVLRSGFGYSAGQSNSLSGRSVAPRLRHWIICRRSADARPRLAHRSPASSRSQTGVDSILSLEVGLPNSFAQEGTFSYHIAWSAIKLRATCLHFLQWSDSP
jgi:hypothetical protein